jgi:hypothetical protein
MLVPLLSACVGAVIGALIVRIRYILTDYRYTSPRYDDIGGKALWLFDSLVAMLAAAILFFRIALWIARRRGPTRGDRWLLIPLAVLLYLLYVANFG